MVFEYGVEDSGELMGSSLNRHLRAMFGLDSSEVGIEGTFAVAETSGSGWMLL